jgi:hypothetical protein
LITTWVVPRVGIVKTWNQDYNTKKNYKNSILDLATPLYNAYYSNNIYKERRRMR